MPADDGGLPSRATRYRRAMPLRAYLIGMILLATAPLAALLSYEILSIANAEQQQAHAHLAQSAWRLARSVERQLGVTQAALAALAQTDAVQRRDPTAISWLLHAQPSALPEWSSVYLLDDTGQVVFDSGHANVDAVANREQVKAVAARGKASVLREPSTAGPTAGAIAMALPVETADSHRLVLAARIKNEVWQQLLEEAREPGVDLAVLLDAQRRLIARVPARSGTGAGATEATPPVGQGAASGMDGEPAYVAWSAVPLSDWQVATSVRSAPLAAARAQVLHAMLASTAACLAVGMSLALMLAWRVSRPLGRLAAGRPLHPADPGYMRIREVDQLSDALLASALQNATAQDRLKRNADEFETLFASSPVALAFAQDSRCDVVLRNAAMHALLAPAAELSRAGSVRVWCRGRELEPQEQPLQRAARLGEAVSALEMELWVPGRAPLHVLAHAVPLRDTQGTPRGAISALVDITERKLAEARLLSADQHLHEKQYLIDLAQEACRVGFFHYRFDVDTLAWTPGLAQLFGLQGEQMESTLGDWEKCIEPADRPGIERALRTMLAECRETHTLEFRIQVAGAPEPRWLSTRVVLRYAEGGRPVQMVGVTMDMTDQRHAERERIALIEREQAARREAEAANRAKDEFLAMLSHELRNPLSAIAAAVEVLNRSDAAADVTVRARSIIGRQTRHLAHMVDDLLDVTRVISGKVLLSRAKLDLAALVKRVLATMELTGAMQRHSVHFQTQEVWIDADPTRIEQVLSNLIDNALKYTPEGGRIDVEVRRQQGQAVLAVRDSGMGIAPELLPRIFDLFVQGERTLDRRAGGLGLGLTLVRRLVELQGGAVTAESSEAGSVFKVRLPALEHPDADPSAPVYEAPGRWRVAVIEDNDDVRAALQSMLELDGHTVITAADGVAGLDALLHNQPDAAVIDIGLPGLTGFDVARRSRAAGYAGRMIALSGYGLDHDLGRVSSAGFDAHLVKPVDADRLRSLLAGA